MAIEYDEKEEEDSARGLITGKMTNKKVTAQNGELLNAADGGTTVLFDPSKVTAQVTEVSTKGEVTHIRNVSHSTSVHKISGCGEAVTIEGEETGPKLTASITESKNISPNGSRDALDISSGSTNTTEVHEIQVEKDENVSKRKVKIQEYDLEKILDEQVTHDLYCPICKWCMTRTVIIKKRKRTNIGKGKVKIEEYYDLEEIMDEQKTHDLFCPNCKSCITRRVILRKRKRTNVSKGKVKIEEYDLEKILDEQETHDLYCPNCKSCITRRVIIKKRERTNVSKGKVKIEEYDLEKILDEQETHDLYCLNCTSCIRVIIKKRKRTKRQAKCDEPPKMQQSEQRCANVSFYSIGSKIKSLHGTTSSSEAVHKSSSSSSSSAWSETDFKRFGLLELEDATHNFLEDNIIARGAFSTDHKDEHKRDKPIDLDDLVHDVSAEPINLPLAHLQDITQNFANERKIGQGGFGIVYEGVLQTGRVAVKKLLNSQTIEDEPFYREATFLMSVKHKNIVRFLGYCANTENKAIQMEGSGKLRNYIYTEIRKRLLCFEYMSNGSLDKHLTDELTGLDWHTRYKIIRGICEGLQYLHNEKNILHMDLKPANILLDDFMVPKISDFGISRHLDGISQAVTKRCLASLGYCAPEYLHRGQVSFKLDIFSIGVIITDIVTGRKEDPDRKNVLRRWRNRWNRAAKYPPFGYQQISKCIEIAQRCMLENAKQRPPVCEIISALDEMETTNEPVNADEYTVGQISPYPWELLEVDPLHLHFPFKQNKQIHASLELSNERDDYVAFDIQKPSMLQYCIEPNKGIVPPHSKSSVTITFQAHDRVPDDMLCNDKFIVRCAIVADRFTTYNVNEDVFNGMLGKVVDDVTLTFSFSN